MTGDLIDVSVEIVMYLCRELSVHSVRICFIVSNLLQTWPITFLS